MYQTKLTKEQLAYNLLYHLREFPFLNDSEEFMEETIIKVLTAYEENSQNSSKPLDNE